MGLFTLMLGALWLGQVQGASGDGFVQVSPDALRPLDGSWPARSPSTSGGERDPAVLRGASPGTAGATAAPRRAIAQELAAKSFAAPTNGSLVGRPTTLLEAMGRAADRSQQAVIARAYWRLAAAVGEYHARLLAVEWLQRISPRAEDVVPLRSQRALAAEALWRAGDRGSRAQRSLAEAAGWSFGAPLPADAPHAGPYRTGFNEGLASSTFPPRNRLIHRALPLRRQGMELRAAAVQAADDALEAALDAYRESGLELGVVLSCLARAVEQREGFVAEVCAYNEEIADYALSVAPPDASPRAVVSMLIFPASRGEPSSRPVENLASPQGLPAKRAAVSPATGVEPASAVFPSSPLGSDVFPASPRQPTLAPPKPKQPDAISDEPLPLPPKPIPEHTAQRVPASDRAAGASGKSSALYPALVSASAIARVQDLAAALHWDRRLPTEAGRTVELEECLRGVSSGDRRSVVDAYWTARQQAAAYQVFAEQGDLIEQLAPLVLDHRRQPLGPLDMLQLRAARLAGEADRMGAQVELLRAQFDLTQRAGRPLQGAWLLPSTAPHAGPYRLRLEEQKPEIVQQPSMKRLAATVPALYDALQQRAGAVVEADAARAVATVAYESGGRGIEPVLAAMRWQTAETLAFLQTLTGYNQAIAEYALTVLPSSIPGDQLVPALVLTRR